MKLRLIGWWLPRESPLQADEDERFISLRTAQEEGGIREPYRTEVVPVYIDLEDDSGLVPSGDGLSRSALADAGDQGTTQAIGPESP